MKTMYLVTLTAAIAVFAVPAEPLHAQSNCKFVEGSFRFALFQFTSATTAYAEGFVDGDLPGTFVANYFNIRQSGNGTLLLNGSHTIATGGGTLTTFDRINLLPDRDPGWFHPNSQLHIVEGSAPYAEAATGLLHTHGRVNPGTLEGSIDWKGRICAP